MFANVCRSIQMILVKNFKALQLMTMLLVLLKAETLIQKWLQESLKDFINFLKEVKTIGRVEKVRNSAMISSTDSKTDNNTCVNNRNHNTINTINNANASYDKNLNNNKQLRGRTPIDSLNQVNTAKFFTGVFWLASNVVRHSLIQDYHDWSNVFISGTHIPDIKTSQLN